MFFKGSRYERLADAEWTDPATGRVVRYKRVRLIPPTPARAGHAVAAGERLDHIAHARYHEAERYWRICDANRAMWPDDLLEPGAVLAVPPAEGDA